MIGDGAAESGVCGGGYGEDVAGVCVSVLGSPDTVLDERCPIWKKGENLTRRRLLAQTGLTGDSPLCCVCCLRVGARAV